MSVSYTADQGKHLLTTELVDFIKDHVKAVAMTNSVHARDLIEGDARRTFMFDVGNITCSSKSSHIIL
jgi:hypothetical protein